MQATAIYNNKNNQVVAKDFDFDGTRQGLLKESSKFLLKVAIPSQLTVMFPNSSLLQVVYKITKRGTYKENGTEYPSMYIPTVIINNQAKNLPEGDDYKKCHLTCIHPESNNYKAYIIEPDGDNILCKYGSIDEVAQGKVRTVNYKRDLYWVRYYEKLSKGYTDQSDILLSDETEADTNANPLTFTHKLYEELYHYAENVVNDILECPMKITEKQVKKCREIWNMLGKETTLEGFNNKLKELLVISPRRRRPLQDNVNMYFAKSSNDFTPIIDFEDNLISAMEGTYYAKNNGQMNLDNNLPIIIDAAEDMRKHILSTLPSDIAKRVEKVYKVIDINRQQTFELYCQQKNITNIQQLWHGSRNENWLSIIKNGLQINPNAKITGKMFGKGIYFAPNPKKSYGYTSCLNTYWAKGNMNVGFMGLYNTAVGVPYYATCTGTSAEQATKKNNKDCLFAEKGKLGLYNDEVVFYDERAVCLSYLVKIKS